MIGGKNKKVEDLIIEFLSGKPGTAKDIFKFVKTHKKISLQAVYDQIRKLVVDEILVKAKSSYTLNQEWLDRVNRNFFNTQEIVLEEGERAVHTFKTTAQVDLYWKHVFHLYESLLKDEDVFIYNPHFFWVHVKGLERSNVEHLEIYKKKKKRCYFLMGNTKLGTEVKKRFSDNYLKINCINIKVLENTKHVTVIGDVILSVRLSKAHAEMIDEVYKDNKITLEEKIVSINDVVSVMKRFNLSIERSKEKAEKLKKIIGRDFYIPKSEARV